MTITSVTFEVDWLELTPANRWYKDRWSKTANAKAWREAGLQAGRLYKLPKGEWSAMKVQAQARYQKGQLTDFDAFAPAMKALVDGLVLGPKKTGYGVVRDDSGEYVHGLTLLPPYRDPDKRTALIVTLERTA